MKFISVSCTFARLFSIASVILFALFANHSYAQIGNSVAYKCAGGEYTDKPHTSKNGGCKILEGGNVGYVHPTPPIAAVSTATNTSPAPVKVASVTPQSSSSSSSRNDSTEQKMRDSDARGILESELKKAEAKQAELLKEYNNGEPDRHALEIRNPQRYVDRVAELKANIARNDSDIAGIKRELGRNQGSSVRAN